MFDHQRLRTDLLALGLLAVTVFAGVSLFSYDPADPPADLVYPARSVPLNLCGMPGAYVAHTLRCAFGVGAYLLVFMLAFVDVQLFGRSRAPDLFSLSLGTALMLAVTCTACWMVFPHLGGGPIVGSGGYVGAWAASILQEHLNPTGIQILLSASLLSSILLTSETFVFRTIGAVATAPIRLFRWMNSRRDSLEQTFAPFRTRMTELGADEESGAASSSDEHGEEEHEVSDESELEANDELDSDADEVESEETGEEAADDDEQSESAPTPRKQIRVNRPATAAAVPSRIPPRPTPPSQEPELIAHALPEATILEVAEEFPYELLAKKARAAATTLERTFKEFGLNVRVVEIDTGPVITQFELELEAGLRLSKVSALADDLAIALRVPSVRVVAPIPGKNTVGVEVPNDKQVMVRLRELIESCPQETETKRIPIFLGKDVSGRPLSVDLAKMPHLLIAGRTGTGKSVCLNTLILSILMTRTPEQVRMLMIDPKMVELSPYMRIPHLMHPVITDMKKAEAILAWAVDKMEERYDLLARCGVRHLDSYNKLGRAEIMKRLGEDPESEEAARIPATMPYIVIIADEMADMIMTSGKEVEGHIIRLAQKSRAVGIHLVLATQKPTVDVITGLIKSNLPARIAFQVASRVDSRVVLDEMGADKLLGNGDMLYLAPGTSHLLRAQGTYVSDDEVNKIIDFYGDQEPQYSHELAQLSMTGGGAKGGIDAIRSRDDMYEPAIEVVVREGRGSVSLLQRCLGIGYGRAARLIDYMAEDGIVGDYNGSQAREVLYTLEQWQALVAGEELEEAAN